MKKLPRLFLDANIYISALTSPIGPSGRLLKLGKENRYKTVTAKFLLLEVERNLKKKLPEALPYFYEDITQIDFKLVKSLDPRLVSRYQKIIEYPPDSLVLAAADLGKSDYLITLDKKHLLKEEVRKLTSYSIIRPEEYLRLINKL